MSKRSQIFTKNLNTSPGTLTYVGKEVSYATKISLIEYNEHFHREAEVKHLSACLPDDNNQITWLNVDGIHEPETIASIGAMYELHPLLLEDVMNTQQKPKLELYDDDETIFATFKHLEYNPFSREIEIEHLSLVLGDGYLVSFQEERQRDIFTPVIGRIKASVGKTRRNGADYLFYALIDTVVDGYFAVLEKVGERLEIVEEAMIKSPQSKYLNDLYSLKRELTLMRKVVWPLREMMGFLLRDEQPLISTSTYPYLRDLNDHITQVIETIDSYRELIASLLDLYMSSMSNRLNDVMKVLTIISVIFLPLNLVVGFYGMNFDELPGIHGKNGHLWVLSGMLAIVVTMLWYFRRKHWI